jgi:hypothetical protein
MSNINRSGKLVAALYYKSPAGRAIEDIRFRKLIESSSGRLTPLDKNLQIIYRGQNRALSKRTDYRIL